MKGNILTRKFRKCTDEVKVKLFRAHCMSMFGCVIWSSFGKSVYNDVRIAYNNTFRWLFGLQRMNHVSPSFLSYGIPTFDVIVRKLTYSFMDRVYNSSNCILNVIVNSSFFHLNSRCYSRWMKILQHHIFRKIFCLFIHVALCIFFLALFFNVF